MFEAFDIHLSTSTTPSNYQLSTPSKSTSANAQENDVSLILNQTSNSNQYSDKEFMPQKLQQKIDDGHEPFYDYEDSIWSHKSKLYELNMLADTHSNHDRRLNKYKKANHTDSDSMKSYDDKLKDKIKMLEHELKKLKHKNISLHKKNLRLENSIKNKNDKIAGYKHKINDSNKEIEILKHKLSIHSQSQSSSIESEYNTNQFSDTANELKQQVYSILNEYKHKTPRQQSKQMNKKRRKSRTFMIGRNGEITTYNSHNEGLRQTRKSCKSPRRNAIIKNSILNKNINRHNNHYSVVSYDFEDQYVFENEYYHSQFFD